MFLLCSECLDALRKIKLEMGMFNQILFLFENMHVQDQVLA